MVGVTGLEPVTPSMSRKYSNQLSYTPIHPEIRKESPRRESRRDGGERFYPRGAFCLVFILSKLIESLAQRLERRGLSVFFGKK